MPTHFALTGGQLVPLAAVKNVAATDLTDPRTARYEGKPGNSANDFIGGAQQVAVPSATRYILTITYNDGRPTDNIDYATSAARNTDRTNLLTALTTDPA